MAARSSRSPYSKYSPGVRAGVFFEYNFGRVSIETDLLYSMQNNGAFYDDGNKYNSTKANYLILPIKAKIYVTNKKTYGFNLFVGPELDVTLRDDMYKNPSYYIGLSPIEPTPLYLAVNFGLGYKFKNGIDLSAGYSNSVMTIVKYQKRCDHKSVFNLSIAYNILQKK